MSAHGDLIEVGEGLFHIRGSFRTAGILDIGTQAALVRRRSGRFVLLDACPLSAAGERELARLTNGGQDVEAVVHLHPFHTIHVRAMHARLPNAKLYGTRRHHLRLDDLPWEPIATEEPAMADVLAGDLELSVPRGVEFVASDPKVHFSSVLAHHPASRTLYVDDTFVHIRFPPPLRWLGLRERTRLHPTLGRALSERAGAAADFRRWGEEIVESWGDATSLCAAHTAQLIRAEAPIRDRLRGALERAEPTLRKHEKRYG